MNVDKLNERAGHPADRLRHLHGSIFHVKCTNCDVILKGVEAEHAIRSLLEREDATPLNSDLIPRCATPGCNGFLRPGMVWFTESIPQAMMKSIYARINDQVAIDTMLVIGTSALVYPATAYIEAARRKGARVAVVNVEQEDPSLLGLEEQDWYFQGDAAEIMQKILKPIL